MQEEFHLQPPSMESSDHACSTPILLTEPLVRQSISQVMLMFISHSKRLASVTSLQHVLGIGRSRGVQ